MQNQPSSKIDLETLVKDGRRHPEPSCRYLATHRNDYMDIPISELITLPLCTTLIDLQRLNPGQVKCLAKITSKRNKGDFVTTLAKHCKGLEPTQRAAALFEGAIHLVESTSIPPQTTAEGWEEWVSVSHAQLHWLQHYSSKANDGDAHPPNASVDEGKLTAIMADVGKVEDIVGHFLRIGLRTSWVRKKESGRRLTEAVRLHMSPVMGNDFRLEIWIGVCAGQTISQLISTGDDLRDVLGDYLHAATESSKTKPSARLTWTGMDCKLDLMVGFEEGCTIHETVFP